MIPWACFIYVLPFHVLGNWYVWFCNVAVVYKYEGFCQRGGLVKSPYLAAVLSGIESLSCPSLMHVLNLLLNVPSTYI